MNDLKKQLKTDNILLKRGRPHDEHWHYLCQQKQIPMIIIGTGTKYATLNIDSITIDISHDDSWREYLRQYEKEFFDRQKEALSSKNKTITWASPFYCHYQNKLDLNKTVELARWYMQLWNQYMTTTQNVA